MAPIFWVQKQDIGPSPRARHGMAFDTARHRVVVFGGDPGGPPLADTWEWDGSLWTQVADTGPSPRHGLSLAEHAPAGGGGQRLVLFGGASGALFLADTWTYDGTDWIQVADTGPKPRAGHAAAFDATRQRLVLFGGHDGAPLGDTWEWNGTDWTQLEDVGPSARRGHAMAWDAARGRVVLFGGAGADGAGKNDTWAWDGTAWTQVADTGPDPRAEAAMAGDASVLLFGGVNSIDPGLAAANRVVYGDTWRLTAQGWSKVQDIGPAGRWGHRAVVSKGGATQARVVLFGGAAAFAPAEDAALAPAVRSDTWEVPDAPVAGAGGGGVVTGGSQIQIATVKVQPSQASAAPFGAQLTVLVTTNVPVSGATVLSVAIVQGPPPGQPINPPGFNFAPPVIGGGSSATQFTIQRDGTFLQTGQYGVAVQIGGGARVVGSFLLL